MIPGLDIDIENRTVVKLTKWSTELLEARWCFTFYEPKWSDR